MPFFNSRCVVSFFSLLGKTIKKRNESIYLRGLIFSPFFCFGWNCCTFICAIMIMYFLFDQVHGAESTKPAVTFHRYYVWCLNYFNCFVRGFVERFLNMVPLVNWLTVKSAPLECAIYWEWFFLGPSLFHFLLIMCSWSPNAVCFEFFVHVL